MKGKRCHSFGDRFIFIIIFFNYNSLIKLLYTIFLRNIRVMNLLFFYRTESSYLPCCCCFSRGFQSIKMFNTYLFKYNNKYIMIKMNVYNCDTAYIRLKKFSLYQWLQRIKLFLFKSIVLQRWYYIYAYVFNTWLNWSVNRLSFVFTRINTTIKYKSHCITTNHQK